MWMFFVWIFYPFQFDTLATLELVIDIMLIIVIIHVLNLIFRAHHVIVNLCFVENIISFMRVSILFVDTINFNNHFFIETMLYFFIFLMQWIWYVDFPLNFIMTTPK